MLFVLEGLEYQDPAAAYDLAAMFACAPALLFPERIETGQFLSADEETCLSERLTEEDVIAILTINVPVEAVVPAFQHCLQYDADDHTNAIDGATALAVGEAAQGSIDYDGDDDFFAFQAEQGKLYRIDLELGTLEDSGLALYNADYTELGFNDDTEDSLASQILWEAPSSGEYYVAAWGYDTGSYTLSVTTVTDDHANAIDGATALAVGEAAQGSIDYDGDEDYFAFQAEEGKVYNIDLELGTLEDSGLALYNADYTELGFNDDTEDSLASQILWEAPRSGEYYVAVWGYDTGSYTLSVTAIDVTVTDSYTRTVTVVGVTDTGADDHANAIEGATALTVGKAAQGSIDYEGDDDFFAFQAEQGKLYRIDLELGTLEDSGLALYNADYTELAFNDNTEDSLASQITWEAPSSGEYYVVAWGYGTGSYTLTVTAVDDETATAVATPSPAWAVPPLAARATNSRRTWTSTP